MKKLLLVLFLFTMAASAQSNPDSVVISYFNYISNNEWGKTFTLYAPEDRLLFREFVLLNFTAYSDIRKLFPEGTTVEQIKDMDDEILFLKLLGPSFDKISSMGLKLSEFKIIGSFDTGDNDKQYIINYTVQAAGNKATQKKVVHIKKYDDKYYMKYDEDEVKKYKTNTTKGLGYTLNQTQDILLYSCYTDTGNVNMTASELIALDLRTNEQIRLTKDKFSDSEPRFDLERKNIYFQSDRPTGNSKFSDIYYYNLATAQISSVVNSMPRLSDQRINQGSWSANNQFAWSVENDPSKETLSIYNKATEKNTVIDSGGTFNNIKWSEDGNYLFYAKNITNITEDFVYSDEYTGILYSSGKKEIIIDSTIHYYFIDWLPGKNEILVSHNKDSVESFYRYNVDKKEFIPWFNIKNFNGRFECFGESENSLFAIKFEESTQGYSRDIWLYDIKKDSFTRITNDGTYKEGVYYSRY